MMSRLALASLVLLLGSVVTGFADPPPLSLLDPNLLADEKLPPKKAIPETPSLPIFRMEDVSPPIQYKNYTISDPPIDALTFFGVRADFLAWRMRDSPIGVPVVFNRTASQIAIGNETVNLGTFDGARVGATVWFDRDHTMGLDVDGIFFQSRSTSRLVRSDGTGSPQYDRPFVNSATNQPFSIPLSIPSQLDGGLATTLTQRFSTVDANLTARLFENYAVRLDFLGGFRYGELREGVSITEGTQVINTDPNVTVTGGNLGPLATGSSLVISDQFRVYNEFYGGQLGLRSYWTSDIVFVMFTGKAGLGLNRETVRVNGSTTLASSASTAGVAPIGGQNGFSAAQGLFTGPSNIGSQTHDATSFLGEGNLTLGVNVAPRLKMYFGYSLLWWTNVIRAGGQLSNVVNASQVPFNTNPAATIGVNQPSVPFRQSDFWAFGWNIGASWEF